MASPASLMREMGSLYPDVSPWAAAALWHGIYECPEPSTPLADELGDLLEQRLSPLLLSYVYAHGIRLPVGVSERLHVADFAWAARSHTVVGIAQASTRMLSQAGIDYVISKGPGIASLYEPGLRSFADIDLLVRPGDFARANAIFHEAGYAERLDNHQPWRAFDRWCREGVNLEAPDGGRIDLHHHVPPWFWASRLTVDRLLGYSTPTSFSGVELPCLRPEANLLVAALHVVSDRSKPGRSLLVWRDIAQLARVANLTKVVALAVETGLDGWLSAIVRALPAFAQPTGLTAMLASPDITRGARRLRMTLQEHGRFGLRVTQPLRLPVASAVLYEVGMAIPSRRFLAGKYPGVRHAYLRWWHDALWHSSAHDRSQQGSITASSDFEGLPSVVELGDHATARGRSR